MSKDNILRTGFNRDARLYHAIRPHYPESLFDDLINIAGLPAGASLLEIGPGTGQATGSLAKRGYKITAIELGSHLAAVAREVLSRYQNVEVLTGAFEDAQFSPNSFDLVYAATAFHWIAPDVRFTKPYDLLKEKGFLAIIHTNHVSDEAGDEFFFASQPIYKRYGLDDPDLSVPPKTVELQPYPIDTNLFSLTFFNAYPVVVNYSADEFVNLISTYSPMIAMPDQKRAGFLRAMSRLIEQGFDGSVNKHFAMTLTLLRKR